MDSEGTPGKLCNQKITTMRITLNILEDKEFKTSIREAIKAEVLSITRKEIEDTVKDEIKRKIEAMDDQNLTALIASATVKAIENIMYNEFEPHKMRENIVVPLIKSKADYLFSDEYLTAMTRKLLQEKMEKIISALKQTP